MTYSGQEICGYLGDSCENYDFTDINQITQYELVYYPSISTSTPYEIHVHSYYIPVMMYIVIAIPVLFIMNRLFIEFSIRFRRNKG